MIIYLKLNYKCLNRKKNLLEYQPAHFEKKVHPVRTGNKYFCKVVLATNIFVRSSLQQLFFNQNKFLEKSNILSISIYFSSCVHIFHHIYFSKRVHIFLSSIKIFLSNHILVSMHVFKLECFFLIAMYIFQSGIFFSIS